MNKREQIEKDLNRLIIQGEKLLLSIQVDESDLTEEQKKEYDELNLPVFRDEYESWYSEALQVIKSLLPSRVEDFIALYKEPKRKSISYSTYTLSDYMIGIKVSRGYDTVVDGKSAPIKFSQQNNILKSVKEKFSSKLFDIEHLLQADIFDSELDASEELLRKGFIRAAGAVSGVVLEKHLKTICEDHKITFRKKNPSINDFNDLLKKEEAIDIPTFRKLQHLADLRNLCDHSKDREPTSEEIQELIDGTKKITKTVF